MIYSALTDVGMKRTNNEDSYIVNTDNKNKIFIVADGMGGHNAGEVASLEACRIVESGILTGEGTIEEILVKAVQKANREIFIRASEDETKSGMGTTIDAAVICDDTLYIAHVGDSRVYLVSEDEITKITHDHSIVGMMLDSGSITEEEARLHPQRNLITRAVGTAMTVEVDIVKELLHSDGWVLMCTDGLTSMVPKNDIHNIIINSSNVNDAVSALVEKAKENGGDDNITAILLKMKKGGER